MPLISVIVPAYNKSPHIKRCINSILNQTYKDFDLIVVYDQSSDDTLKEIEKFTDSRIRLFKRDKPGPGGYAARNLGIEKATADWIAFLDADDEWYPDHLENLVRVIEEYPQVGIIGAGFNSINNDKKSTQPYYTENKSRGSHKIPFTRFIYTYLEKKRFGNTSVIACPRKVLHEVGGFPAGKTNKGGDLYTWIKIFAKYDGAWSPHLGANTYHDAVNKVTNSSYFDIAFLKRVCDEVELSSKDMKLLKKYINSLIFKDYIRHILNQGKRGFLLGKTMFFLDPIKHSFYMVLDMMPFSLLNKLVVTRFKTGS